MIINLTPHDIHIQGATISASGKIARVQEELVQIAEIDGFPVMQQVFGDAFVADKQGNVLGAFPEQESGTFFVVSILVAQAMRDRDDLLVAVGQTRDPQGRINGCTGLAQA